MELLQLKYFKALAERNHLTSTAKDLHVSAPALSATITRLERELGVKLFDRTGRNISLNKFGMIYLKHVNNVFATLENAELELLDAQTSQQNKLSLAISSPIIWHEALSAFVGENSKIPLSHTIINLDMMKNAAYSSQFDFIITALGDLPEAEWNYEILCTNDRPVLAVYPNHPFAQRKQICFSEAKDEQFIALSKGYSFRKFFDEFCAIAGFRPKIALECDYALRVKMLASECGIVLTTESVMRTDALGDAVYVKIDSPDFKRTQAIFWNKQRYMSKNATTFFNFMTDYYKSECWG